jgi:hypothetical protein
MSTLVEPRKMTGPENLALTLLFAAPSALSLFASYAVMHDWLYSTSALWFIYEISFYLGVLGAVLAGSLTTVQVARRELPAAFLWLMGISTAAAVLIVWYAAHIFRSPW